MEAMADFSIFNASLKLIVVNMMFNVLTRIIELVTVLTDMFRPSHKFWTVNYDMVAELRLCVQRNIFNTTAHFKTVEINHTGEIINDAESTEKIILSVNMVGASTGAAQYATLDKAQIEAHMDQVVNATSAHGKFFDNLKPPAFTGKREDFEAWTQRFDWFIKTKSSVFSSCLSAHESLPPGLSLQQVGSYAADQARDINTGGAIIKMAIELHGYLQSALQD